ncbi:disease resistance protein RPS2-like isoform X1 [Triticum urartu]|uniref:disease resistance protein RPS2-like isoform X1 n=1 Tax=Triticum urartu TaxID=4572 RepID=UPI002043AB0E|nr:disease resistance protein RPS2-like isoform X1 [Triticum urartu]XP_048566252.1 disease resistance protein RPS2-like isoform X1 [Triticum urartu]
MEAHAPPPPPPARLLPQTVGLFTSPAVAFILLVLNKIWDPIFDCYCFLLDPGRHMTDYNHAVQRVVAMKRDFNLSDPSPTSHQGGKWLERVVLLQKDKEMICKSYAEGGFLKKWYYIRKAIKETKKADDMASQFKEILVESKPRPRPVARISPGDPLEIMKTYTDKVVEFIKNESEDSKLLGIWGMAGVGKSVLIRNISMCHSQYAAADTPFQILFVDAGSDSSICKIQNALFGLLGLALTPDVTESVKAFTISSYLSENNFLLLLDDVREPFDLARIGVPVPDPASAMCRKVVFTTRTHAICASMGCDSIMQMSCPTEEDATKIFNCAVGTKALEDSRFCAVSSVLIKECGLLPEALRNVGLSMSIKDGPEQWELAVKLLRQAKLHLVTHKKDNLFERLRCSYDELEAKIKECLVLICSLWSEDANIPIDSLILMWIGMGLLDGLNAQREGYAYIRMLQQRCLLEKGQNTLTSSEDTHVRMNPMIRKAIIKTLDNREANWFPDLPWRSSLTEKTWLVAQRVWASAKDFEMFKRKCYLDQNNKERSKLLQSNVTVLVSRCVIKFDLCQFHQLVFLDMEGATLPNFPERVTKMNALEYLNLSSTGLTSVPSSLGDLSKLKYLFLRRNPELEHIPIGVIAKLKELKVLDLFDTGCLLTSLINEIKELEMDCLMAGFTVETENILRELRELSEVCPLYMCLSRFETEKVDLLYLLADFDKLHELQIKSSHHVLKLVYTDLEVQSTPKIFTCLERFIISNLPNLVSIDLKPEGLNIKSVKIYNCNKLTDITWILNLVNLEELVIKDCCRMRTLISASAAEELGLPRLKRVELHGLPELLTLSEAAPLCFKSVIHWCVFQCRKLSGLPKPPALKSVLLDCDVGIWNKMSQTGVAAQFAERVHL